MTEVERELSMLHWGEEVHSQSTLDGDQPGHKVALWNQLLKVHEKSLCPIRTGKFLSLGVFGYLCTKFCLSERARARTTLERREREAVTLLAPRPAGLCCILEVHKRKGPDNHFLAADVVGFGGACG